MANEATISGGKKHHLILENRKNLSMSGVLDVSGFDDETVVLQTSMGEISVKGYELRINRFSVESGELSLDGKIHSLIYAEEKQQEGGFFSRIFK